MKISCRFLLPLVTVSMSLFGADLTLTFQTQAKGFLSSASGTQTEYMTSRYLFTRDEGTKIDHLVDYEKGISYTINHKKKTIEFLKFEDALVALEQASSAMASVPKEVSGMLGKLMGGDANEVSVTNAGSDTVAGHPCVAWKIKVGKLTADLSVDPKLMPPVPDAAWAKAMKARAASFAAAGPMAASYRRLYEEMAKIKGVALKSKLMGVERTATKVAEGPVDASVFVLPAAYRTEDVGKKMREELEKTKSKG